MSKNDCKNITVRQECKQKTLLYYWHSIRVQSNVESTIGRGRKLDTKTSKISGMFMDVNQSLKWKDEVILNVFMSYMVSSALICLYFVS